MINDNLQNERRRMRHLIAKRLDAARRRKATAEPPAASDATIPSASPTLPPARLSAGPEWLSAFIAAALAELELPAGWLGSSRNGLMLTVGLDNQVSISIYDVHKMRLIRQQLIGADKG